MASAGKFSVGVENPIQGNLIRPILEQLDKRAGYTGRHLVAQFEVTQALPNALADIEEGYTNIADDLDCATDLIHVASSSADDDWNGAGAQAVRIYYLQGGEVLSVDYNLDGQVHVHLAALGTIDRIIGMEIIASPDAVTPAVVVPVGNITIDVHATGTVYCTIVAGDLYSITTKMWVPTGWSMVVIQMVSLITIAEAAAPLLADGMNVGINVNGKVESRSMLPQYIGEFTKAMPFNLPLEGEAYICVQHSQLDTDATACTGFQCVLYLLYETP